MSGATILTFPKPNANDRTAHASPAHASSAHASSAQIFTFPNLIEPRALAVRLEGLERELRRVEVAAVALDENYNAAKAALRSAKTKRGKVRLERAFKAADAEAVAALKGRCSLSLEIYVVRHKLETLEDVHS